MTGKAPDPSNFDSHAYGTYMHIYHHNQDFYAVLSVDETASAAEIKKQYKKLALQYHPGERPNAWLTRPTPTPVMGSI